MLKLPQCSVGLRNICLNFHHESEDIIHTYRVIRCGLVVNHVSLSLSLPFIFFCKLNFNEK